MAPTLSVETGDAELDAALQSFINSPEDDPAALAAALRQCCRTILSLATDRADDDEDAGGDSSEEGDDGGEGSSGGGGDDEDDGEDGGGSERRVHDASKRRGRRIAAYCIAAVETLVNSLAKETSHRIEEELLMRCDTLAAVEVRKAATRLGQPIMTLFCHFFEDVDNSTAFWRSLVKLHLKDKWSLLLPQLYVARCQRMNSQNRGVSRNKTWAPRDVDLVLASYAEATPKAKLEGKGLAQRSRAQGKLSQTPAATPSSASDRKRATSGVHQTGPYDVPESPSPRPTKRPRRARLGSRPPSSTPGIDSPSMEAGSRLGGPDDSSADVSLLALDANLGTIHASGGEHHSQQNQKPKGPVAQDPSDDDDNDDVASVQPATPAKSRKTNRLLFKRPAISHTFGNDARKPPTIAKPEASSSSLIPAPTQKKNIKRKAAASEDEVYDHEREVHSRGLEASGVLEVEERAWKRPKAEGAQHISVGRDSMDRLCDPKVWLDDTVVYATLQRLVATRRANFLTVDPLLIATTQPAPIIFQTLESKPNATILLAINVDQIHWVLAAVTRTRKAVDVYDSLLDAVTGPAKHQPKPTGPSEVRDSVRAKLESFVAVYLRDEDFSQWSLARAACVQQQDEHNCGVAVLAHATYLVAGETLPGELNLSLWRLSIARLLWQDGSGADIADVDNSGAPGGAVAERAFPDIDSWLGPPEADVSAVVPAPRLEAKNVSVDDLAAHIEAHRAYISTIEDLKAQASATRRATYSELPTDLGVCSKIWRKVQEHVTAASARGVKSEGKLLALIESYNSTLGAIQPSGGGEESSGEDVGIDVNRQRDTIVQWLELANDRLNKVRAEVKDLKELSEVFSQVYKTLDDFSTGVQSLAAPAKTDG